VHQPPDGLPAVDELVDSAGLHTAVVDLWQAHGSPPGSALYTLALTRDSTKAPVNIALIESGLPKAMRDSLTLLVWEYVRQPPQRTLRARLRIEGGPAPRFRVGATETCRPAMRNRANLQRLLARAAEFGVTSGTAYVWAFVDTLGRVENANIQRSSGSRSLDQYTLWLAYGMEFHPALMDRVRVPVWVALPVTIESNTKTSEVPAGRNIASASEVRIYDSPEVPKCGFMELGRVTADDYWSLARAVWSRGGDAVIGIHAVQGYDSRGIRRVARLDGMAIRFTDPDCTW
jgi:hypothetical protein